MLKMLQLYPVLIKHAAVNNDVLTAIVNHTNLHKTNIQALNIRANEP